jgi:hypothetical protein
MRGHRLVELRSQHVDAAVTLDRLVDPRLVDLAGHPEGSSPGVPPSLHYGIEPYRIDEGRAPLGIAPVENLPAGQRRSRGLFAFRPPDGRSRVIRVGISE